MAAGTKRRAESCRDRAAGRALSACMSKRSAACARCSHKLRDHHLQPRRLITSYHVCLALLAHLQRSAGLLNGLNASGRNRVACCGISAQNGRLVTCRGKPHQSVAVRMDMLLANAANLLGLYGRSDRACRLRLLCMLYALQQQAVQVFMRFYDCMQAKRAAASSLLRTNVVNQTSGGARCRYIAAKASLFVRHQQAHSPHVPVLSPAASCALPRSRLASSEMG